MNTSINAADAPVLIAGGGLVGLSTAMFLAQHGIGALVIERLRGTSALPRAAHFHLRTLELFRLAGIEDEVRHRSEQEFLPEGAIVSVDSLAGKKIADIIGELNAGVEALSPCRRLFITQPGLEPILRHRAQRGGARILEGYEIVGVAQRSSSVTVIVRDVDTGAERTLRGQYLVGADGARSKIRELIGIPLEGRGAFSSSMTIYFEANLAPLLAGKSLSVIYINNPTFGGVFRLDKDYRSGFLIVNTVGDPRTDPQAANATRDTSEARLVELVRSGAGLPDLPVKIIGLTRWRARSEVAQRYQDGHIFLAGDAAHLMPPNGGFGGNTGIHDAHNLAWKLAWVLKGRAGPELLTSYQTERRPIARFTVEQAYTRYVTRTAGYLGTDDIEPLAPDFNIELGYLYRSPALLAEYDDARLHDDPHVTCGRPGSRAPHLWLEQAGRRISSLDLFGSSFVLLTGTQGEAWRVAAESFADLDCWRIGADLVDADRRFERAYGLSSDGAALVRPDGFVGWRAKEMVADPRRALARALDALLMTGAKTACPVVQAS